MFYTFVDVIIDSNVWIAVGRSWEEMLDM